MNKAIRMAFSSVIAVICGWPMWAFLLSSHAANLHGFWETLASIGDIPFLVVASQLVFTVVFLIGMAFVWRE